ncbi:ArnT family glycosyltransferase [Nocardia sp. NBC_01388]|uniref:ArnT family glycosyltransferase n=1 Tax=Nocardia sp. NBC_01388 TaxID=2903596 RepID=UPI003245D9FF
MTTTLDAAPGANPESSAAPRRRISWDRTVWERIALGGLLIGTAVMYLWNITINGMGNQFYAGAAQAGSKNWEALLFGSLDTGNFITVDKPPVSQWVMGLSGQIFGFSSASMLIPQALMAVAAVALLYGAVTRISGRTAGLVAGAVLALTPVAALMFRFNNPDAVMVLLMMAGAYCTVRALQRGSTLWIMLAGVALGFAFLAKMLEGLMVLPALGLAYLIAAPNPLRTRLLQLFGATVALLASSGWYVFVTLLWPASSRPYIAGSTDNNFMNLVLGYNGFARVLGRNHGGGGRGGQGPTTPAVPPAGQNLPGQTPGVPGAAHGAAQGADAAAQRGGGGFGGFGGQSHGLSRLFGGEFGFEIAWLLPAALLAFVLVLISRGRAPRTDMVRAGAIVFGGWMVIDGLVLSYMQGIIHPYYSLSIAPAIGGMFAIGVFEMWRARESWFGRAGLAALIATSGIWSYILLDRNSSWMPALRIAILVVTLLATVALVIPWNGQVRKRVAVVALIAGLIGAMGGSAAYAVTTIGVAHQGGGPTVGPVMSGAGGNRGGMGGFGGGGQSNPQLDGLLENTTTKWSAATNGSSTAAGLELSSSTAVMAIGGFSGSDPTPTLSQFIDYVKNHQVTYYLVQQGGRGGGGGTPADTAPGNIGGARDTAGGTRDTTGGTRDNGGPGRPAGTAPGDPAAGNAGGGGGFGRNGHTDITNWVAANFKPVTVGSTTVYDLSGYTG